MSHGRFGYSAISRRPPVRFPNGARVAIWITPNIEHFHFGKPAIALTPMTAGLTPDVLNHGWRDYGVRVGIWRLMDILQRQGFPATAALNSEVCLHYPEIIAAGRELGWEWMAHGATNSMLFTGMPDEVERPIVAEVIETITQHTGARPRGWLSPALTETLNTPDLLAEAGIEYTANWCNDELPYTMTTKHGPLVAMPYTLEVGDIPLFLERGGSGEDFYHMLVDQFDTLYREGAQSPRVMSVALHPFLIGHPFRACHLERALAHIRGHDDVWLTTGSELLDWYRAS